MEGSRKKNSKDKSNTSGSKQTKISHEEKLKIKREREQIRRNKIKNDPEKYEQQRQKKKERYLKRKEEKKIKLISDLSEREKRYKGKKWVENNRTYRIKKKELQILQNKLAVESPPPSDIENIDFNIQIPNESQSLKNRRSGRKRKEIAEQKKVIERLKKDVNLYKKRCARIKQSQNTNTDSNADMTPFTKVEQMTKGIEVPVEVKRKLLFGECLQKQLTENFNALKTDRSKQLFTKSVGGSVLKK